MIETDGVESNARIRLDRPASLRNKDGTKRGFSACSLGVIENLQRAGDIEKLRAIEYQKGDQSFAVRVGRMRGHNGIYATRTLCDPDGEERDMVHARDQAQLRMVRPRSAPGQFGGSNLQLRVHLLCRVRFDGPARRLPDLRRKFFSKADPAQA